MRIAGSVHRSRRALLSVAAGVAIAAALASCQRAAPPADSGVGANDSDVEAALLRFSGALASADTAALRALTTPEFAMLDEGRTYDLASLGAAILPVVARGAMDRVPLDFHTTVRGNTAWSHYRVGGFYASGSDTTRLDLLESAVLVRADSTWRVALATTLPASAP